MKAPSLELVLRDHAGLLARIAASYERDPPLREDLLQDIALALLTALPRWRGEGSLRGFVARIAHNRGVDHVVHRSRGGRVVHLDAEWVDPAAGPECVVSDRDRGRALADAIARLPLSLRQVVTLALEGFRNAEIAEALNLAPNTVDVRLSRARAALRKQLGADNEP